jgi:cytochrome c peroxidase
MRLLRSLWIGGLSALPPDPSNRVASDPLAAALGRQLFFDERLSASGQVSCATCHLPQHGFQDGLPLGRGIGTAARRTMALSGAAYSPFFFWDGRKDSQWAQALEPLESLVEHGGTRTGYAHLVARHYRAEYESLFGPLPDLTDLHRFPATAGPRAPHAASLAWAHMSSEDRTTVSLVFANLGKAIAAFERTLVPTATRFDGYVSAVLKGDQDTQQAALGDEEVRGLRLFLGKGRCVTCHSGPLLTDYAFHNTGVPARPGLPTDPGRISGVAKLLNDEFNCLGPFSDARSDQCAELNFILTDESSIGAFKPPSLREVAGRPPFMHAGQFSTLSEVLAHYNHPPPAPVGSNELRPLGLTPNEIDALAAFLRTLTSAVLPPG